MFGAGDESGKGPFLRDFLGRGKGRLHPGGATQVWESGNTEKVVSLEESGRASLGRWCLNWPWLRG